MRWHSLTIIGALLVGCSSDAPLQSASAPLKEAFSDAAFAAAAGCPDCVVLTRARLNLPLTGALAGTAKLRTASGGFIEATVDPDGRRLDKAALITAERTRRVGKGPVRADLDEWLRVSDGSKRWTWLRVDAPTELPRREDALATGGKAPAPKEVPAATTLRAWLLSRGAELGDASGPVLRARLSAADVAAASALPSVREIGSDEYPGKRESAPWSATSEWGRTIALGSAHQFGLAAGARICVKEDTQPDTYARLSVAGIANPTGPSSAHTRAAAGILRNTDASEFPWLSAAPSASIYIGNWTGYTGTGGIDAWCQANSTNTLSFSYSMLGAGAGPLSGTDMAHDWLAKTSPYILVVAAAGDRDPANPGNIYVRNRGFNGLVVGGISDTNTVSASDDVIDTDVAYGNPTTLHNDYELPHVAAPSNGADGAGASLVGSSGSTAMVAGIAALIDGADPALQSWPEAKRAIIIATATGRAGQPQLASLPAGSDQRIGAGVVNAQQAIFLAKPFWGADAYGATTISQHGRLARTVTFASDFDGSGYLNARWKARAEKTGRMRVVLAFDATATCQSGNCSSDTPDADLDLHVFRKTDDTWTTSGTLTCASSTYDSTWEYCDFPVTEGEEYLIAVRKWSSSASSTYAAVAWYNYQLPQGEVCSASTDCLSANCVAGRCAATKAACNDARGSAPVTARWATAYKGSYAATTALGIVLQNWRSTPVTVKVGTRAVGIDQRNARKELGSYTIAGHGSLSLSTTPADFFVQSVTSVANVTIEADVMNGNDLVQSIPSAPLHYQFAASYSTATLYGERPPVQAFASATSEAQFYGQAGAAVAPLFGTEGRYWNGSSWVLVANAQGAGPIVPAQPMSLEAPFGWLDDTLGADPSPGPDQADLCIKWDATFADSGFGETGGSIFKYRAPYAARYARVQILRFLRTSLTLVKSWSGYLDANGCRRFQLAPNQEYIVFVTSKLRKDVAGGAAIFDILYSANESAVDGSILPSTRKDFGSLLAFKTGSTWTTPILQSLTVPLADEVPAAAVTAGAILATPDNGIVASTYPVFARAGSTNAAQFIRLGKDAAGRPDAFWKFVTAHETGHAIQFRLMGFQGNRANNEDDGLAPTSPYFLPASCRCDHVTLALGQSHCLQSREADGAAAIEGFGHFIAARTFNVYDPSAACSFTYYKEYKPDVGGVVAPPFAVNCREQKKWMVNHCLQSERGSEWDWMNFYYAVNTAPAAQQTTTTDLACIYTRVCTGSSALCNEDPVHWPAVESKVPECLTLAKRIRFLAEASNYGVDH